ncbi:MAG: EamA family transporter [Candidatus Moranbacteria bacterium]|nr:EamA family transporter [Candidatus Moranbacteria bacterium]
MDWFLIALIGPVLYAITNHIDKYILEKYFKAGEVGAIVLFSALFSFVALPVIFIIEPSVFTVSIITKIALMVSGSLNVVCLILYLKALQDDEVSVVAPFYQTIPIFGFILGYFILGETLNRQELLSALIILIGTTIVSFDFSDGKPKFKKRVAFLMLTSSVLFAIIGVVFKTIAVDEGFWLSIFWSLSGNIMIGSLIFLFVKSYRLQFLKVFKVNSKAILAVSSLNELIFISADGMTAFATLLAPISLVMIVNGFQPIFVFIIGVVMTLFFPKFGSESLTKNDLIQKILAIIFIASGTILLNFSR